MYNITALPNYLITPLQILADRYHFTLGTEGKVLEYIPCTENILEVSHSNEAIRITAPTLPAFFRAVGMAVQAEQNHTPLQSFRETIWFDFNGLMLDCSRNGVVSVSYAKQLIEQLAIMGHTVFLLYMEDVYEVNGEPYFGYMRGRYSKRELKELDDYAFQFGIELIPCIQTLAHLNQFLSWPSIYNAYADIDDILNVGSPAVNSLLKRMIQSLSECFRSNRIHIGMDEAYHLGRGRYADENGWQTKRQIMAKHLDFMVSLCQTYGLRPIIWDDMFFHYSSDTDPIRIPDGIDVMYWDYYNNTEKHYEENFNIRSSVVKHMMFAGGAWKWTGYAPHHSKTLASANASLSVCKQKGVREVIATSWADDGCECPISACLFGCVLFSEHQYHEQYDPIRFQSRLKFITGMDYELFMKQEQFDILPSFKNKACTVTPSKYLFYEDPLCSLFVSHSIGIIDDLTDHYEQLANFFAKAAESEDDAILKSSHEFYRAFGDVMCLKWNLGLNIWQAYQQKNREAIASIIENQIVPLIPRMERLAEMRRLEWYQTNKSCGFEVLDQRMGAIIQRLKTSETILKHYLSGYLESIPELEENRIAVIPNREEGTGEHIHYNQALRCMSAGKLTWG